MWLGSSVVRVIARFARGPGLESRSGRVLFPSLCHLVASVGECHRGGKSTWPDRDSYPGPLAHCASTLTTELPNHAVDLCQFPPP